jgi:pilus assembly protein CpaE
VDFDKTHGDSVMAKGHGLNVVAIVRSSETGTALNESCANMNGTRVDVHVGKLNDVHPDVEIFHDADVLLLDVDPSSSEEVAALSSIVSDRFPKTPVVATTANASLQDVRQLMRLGVVDVVPQPVTPNDLGTAIEYAARSRAKSEGGEDSGRGKIISVLKAGGGVGATTLAVQAGYLIAQRFKGERHKASLIDLDLQFGNASLYMDIDNRVGLLDLVESPERMDASLLQSVMGRHESGLDVLAAPRDVMPLEVVSSSAVDSCLKVAADLYSYVLVDLPTVWCDWTMQALQKSDIVLLVTQLTVPHVRQARRQLDHLSAHGFGDIPVKVVVNRFEKGWGKGVSAKEAAKAMNRGIDYFVMSDFKLVSEAINQGVPIAKIARRSKVEKSIADLVDSTVKELSGGEVRSEPRLRIGFGR